MLDCELRLTSFQWIRAVCYSALYLLPLREAVSVGEGNLYSQAKDLRLMIGHSSCCLLSCRCVWEVVGNWLRFNKLGVGAETCSVWNWIYSGGLAFESVNSLVNYCCCLKLSRLLYCLWIPKVPLIASPLSKTVQRFLLWAPWRVLSRWEYLSWQIMAAIGTLCPERAKSLSL